MDNSKLKRLLNESKFDQVLHAVESLEKDEAITPENLFTYQHIKCIALNKQGHFEEALQLAEQLLVKGRENQNPLEVVDACIVKAEALEHLGRFALRQDVIKEGEKALSSYEGVCTKAFVERQSSLLDQQGRIFWWKGDLDQALYQFQRSLALREGLNDENQIAESFTNLGATLWLKGKIKSALEHFEKSLGIYKDLGDKQGFASSLNNIGAIFWQKGELDLALQHYQQSQMLFEELGNKQDIAISLGNIGKIYYDKGDIARALEHHKQSLKLRREIGNKQQIAMSLFELISVAVYSGSLDLARNYLKHLQEINEQEGRKIISQQYRVGSALILKTSAKPRERGKAEALLEQVANEKVVHYKLTATALLNLCDLLLAELRQEDDQELFIQVQNIITRLSEIAEEQNSQRMIAEAYLLRSKLSLLELDIQRARIFLTQAQRIAEKWGMVILAMKISKEHDLLLRQLDQWHEVIHRNASLRERIVLSQLNEIIGGLIHRRALESPNQPPEEPVMILIMGKEGLGLFSKTFLPKSQIHEQLLSGFLSAISSFGKEVFEGPETLDRIEYEEHIIAMKRVESIMFAYVFKGQSYSALQKLDQFMERMQSSSRVWKELNFSLETGKTLETQEEITITNAANEIFLTAAG